MRCSWFRHCQTAFVVILIVTLVTGGTLLWQLNKRGFSGEWSARLEQQLSDLGLHADFSSVRLSFTRGLVAKDLKIYSDPQKSSLLASADRLELDIDRNAAVRGEWLVRSARFQNGFLKLPDACGPHNLSHLDGSATLGRENCLRMDEVTGQLGQLNVRLNLALNSFDLQTFLLKAPDDDDDSPTLDFINLLHKELSHWNASRTWPPELALTLHGNLDFAHSLTGTFNFHAPQITRRQYRMNDLSITGSVNSASLRLDEVSFHDGSGPFKGSSYYNFRSRSADLTFDSQASLSRLLRAGLNVRILDRFTFTRAPDIQGKGTLTLVKGQPPQINLTGHFGILDFRFLGTSWNSIDSDFSWQNGDLFLRDLVLGHPDGQLTGRLLFQNDNIRYRATSTLPVKVFEPFLKPDGDIRKTIALAEFTPESKFNLTLKGSIQPNDLTNWTASGKASVTNFSFNKVPAHYAAATFDFTPLLATYSNPEVEFDLTNDNSFRAFGGPERAVVRADSISYDYTEKLTRIDHLHGICWASPVLSLFMPRTAAYLERTFRLTAPPAFSSSGVVDHKPGRKRTSFHTRIQADAPLLYDFLGQTIQLRNSSALIHTHEKQVDVHDLASYTFSGPISGEFSVLLPSRPGRTPDFRGNILWTRLRLADIGKTYGFDNIEKGLVTGRFDFHGTAGKIEKLNGTGNIALEQGELFKAPIFGPLSPLISGLQGHDRASHETARDASASFLVRNGMLYTDDFITTTPSLTVNATGSIDLARKTLDMTARADTKGLLALVTLPLNVTPLSGLFQFHGTGPVSEPEWVSQPFTTPPKKSSPLFAPPPKARVVNE